VRVLLTGAAGFIGAHVLRMILNETDWQVVCPVSFRHKGVPERLVWAIEDGCDVPGSTIARDAKQTSAIWKESRWHRIDVIHCDLASPVNFTTARLFGDVDAILNFASDTHPPRSVAQPVEFWHNNADIALYLLEYARTLSNLQSFVQVSTDAVYGPAVWPSTHYEWDPIVPANVYAASKAAQEALGIAYWRSYGVPLTIMTLMNPIGETQDREKFVPMTIGKVIRGETVQIHADAGRHPGYRTYIDADDVASALMFLLAKPIESTDNPLPPRWNVTGARELNNELVAVIIADALSLSIKTEIIEVDRPEHGHRYAMSGDKLSEAGWLPDPDIETALRRITLWSKEHPQWL
jgi:dTDP-glucose 4,6-dehydratase